MFDRGLPIAIYKPPESPLAQIKKLTRPTKGNKREKRSTLKRPSQMDSVSVKERLQLYRRDPQ